MTEPYLQMTAISKSFPGVQALDNVNIEAYAGEALALIGANGAGKSTLMNVLGGVVRADVGDIRINNQPVTITSPLDATANGIAFVHQEMAMLPTMTVAENMFITSFPTSGARLIDRGRLESECAQVLARLDATFTPDTRVEYLSTGDQQMVEIARALLGNPGIVIFDEPTSSLTSREKARLFEVIGSLKAEGVTIIYITHFLDEIFQICERVTVLRGGKTVGSGLLSEVTTDDIVHLMIGDIDVETHEKRQTAPDSAPVLRVSGLNRTGVLSDINLELHQGEVLGLWGLLGAGRTELARAIIGLDKIDGGTVEIRVNGKLKALHGTEAQRYIGMITEDRRNEGLLLPMSVKQNMSLANLPQLISRWLLIDTEKETALAQQFVKRLNIMISNLEQAAGTLSGGNQQKVVVGRWLELNPPILIMDEPTRGLDVGAKAEIRNIIIELAESGTAILVISSEIEEMMAMAHRYLVIARGRIVTELPGNASKNELMATAAGSLDMAGAATS